MAFDRRPILTLFADKVAVRDYVRERVGPHVLTELYAVVDRVQDLDIASLPERCVIKPSHGSGAVILVDDRAPADAVLPALKDPTAWTSIAVRVRRSALLAPEFEHICRSWLRNRYSPVTEWAYRHVPPRLIVEEMLDVEGDVPSDYKFWCANGTALLVQVDVDRFVGHRRSLHELNWNPIDGTIQYPRPDAIPTRPAHLELMVDIVEALAADIDFVRIDLYDVDGRLIVGEMTNYPEAGGGVMAPERLFSEIFASWKPWRA